MTRMTKFIIKYMDQIPTIKVDIEGKEIEINAWLTQEQEDEYNAIIIGDEGFNMDSGSESVNFKASMRNVSAGRKYLVNSIVKGITWDEFNIASPKFRQGLLAKIEEVRSNEKK